MAAVPARHREVTVQSLSQSLRHPASLGRNGACATHADRTCRQLGCYGTELSGAKLSRMCSSCPEPRFGV